MKSKSQIITELIGPPLCWHEPMGRINDERCSCGFKPYITATELTYHIERSNPNYETDPIALLRVMMGQENWPELFMHLLGDGIRGETPPICVLYFNSFLVKYLTTPGLLAKVVLEWLRRAQC